MLHENRAERDSNEEKRDVSRTRKRPYDLKCRSRQVIRHCLSVCNEFAYVLQCARSFRLFSLPRRVPVYIRAEK